MGWTWTPLHLHTSSLSSAPPECSPFRAQQQKAIYFTFRYLMEQFFPDKRFVIPPPPLPFSKPHPRGVLCLASGGIERNNPERGGVGRGGEAGEGWVGVVAPLHPSLLPSIPATAASMREHLWSHPELGRPVGHQPGLCAAPTHPFAPCLSFPAGKQAPSPLPGAAQ